MNEKSDYGLKVPPENHELIKADEAPVITFSPGESHQAESVRVLKGMSWLLYNPYSTPSGSSPQFVAWQISRAVRSVYGEELSVEEILGNLLETDDSGLVHARSEGMKLKANHIHWKRSTSPSVFPFLYGSVVFLYLLLLTIMFRGNRYQKSARNTRFLFWSMMATLLGLHLGGLSSFMGGFTDDWIIRGTIIGSMQRWEQAGSGTTVIAYTSALVLIAMTWSAALKQFRQLEPPKH